MDSVRHGVLVGDGGREEEGDGVVEEVVDERFWKLVEFGFDG